ncbi:MAG: Fe-S cluster assembly protein SufD, partial [Chroococcidiopsidaceae cyanobacterium CP_BM_RX_35]|nr:Fe-S cluster assembly protein SufD [Chroococcidiopsidaceae cyanobacterium CP_BM_RX_35]
DTHSVIALNYPHGTSNQLHKCIIADRAHAVFNGKIFVPQPAQLTNAVTEIWLEADAQVNHTRVERESPEAFHIGKTAIAQARNSRYTCNAITLGAKLSRHNLEVFQRGEQTETTLNGLVTITGQQMTDTHSTIALNYPHGTSTQLHKCIIANQAHAVFNGKIFVPQSAQLTNAGQLNRNLLLSPKARVDTKPQLEITADNVKCTHGATVSQLDEEEIFYLQSRGLDATEASHLLINAFATEIINKIPVASLQQTLIAAVSHQRLALNQ